LRCGALVALSFVRVHYPEINLELLKALPPTPSGRVDMDPLMLLVRTRLIVSPDRLSPRVIIRGRIRASRRNDLAKRLNLAYLLYMYVSREILQSACANFDESWRSRGEALERRSKGKAPEHRSKGEAPSVGQKAKPPSVGRKAKPPSVGQKAKPPSVGRKAKPPSVGRKAKPPSVG
jgi:hypothetical protein